MQGRGDAQFHEGDTAGTNGLECTKVYREARFSGGSYILLNSVADDQTTLTGIQGGVNIQVLGRYSNIIRI